MAKFQYCLAVQYFLVSVQPFANLKMLNICYHFCQQLHRTENTTQFTI
jgi:hypothetical protein